MATTKGTRRERAAMVLAGARERLLAPQTDERVREAGLRVLSRAERVMARLEGVAGTLETAARVEVELLARLVPIVDDLGELVRHTLDEARERRGLGKRHGDGDVIDTTAEVIDTRDRE